MFMSSYNKYDYYLGLVNKIYWIIVGLICLMTAVNFAYNDAEGETVLGAFFISILLIGMLQILFVPLYFVVRRISSAVIANSVLKPRIDTISTKDLSEWKLPPTTLLSGKNKTSKHAVKVSPDAELLTKIIKKYGCDVVLDSVDSGPRLHSYHFKPKVGEGIDDKKKLERAVAQTLDDNTARVHVDDKLNGLVHIEIVRSDSSNVNLKELLESDEYKKADSPLVFPLGITATGENLITDLRKLPHLMIGGQTGSGKSVMIHDILTGLLMKHSPETLRLILIDPKWVELTIYDGIPHLLREVIHAPEEATKAFEWLVDEMERRFYQLAETQTMNIEEFNNKESTKMPYIILVVDEFADLMMMDGETTENLIVKLAQKARAVGIHMVISTSRPSVDVYTGMIKANLPARISFTTASQIDSRTIIDVNGAEKLLGRGDMFYSDTETWPPIRAHAALITDEEVIKVTDFLREQSI